MQIQRIFRTKISENRVYQRKSAFYSLARFAQGQPDFLFADGHGRVQQCIF